MKAEIEFVVSSANILTVFTGVFRIFFFLGVKKHVKAAVQYLLVKCPMNDEFFRSLSCFSLPKLYYQPMGCSDVLNVAKELAFETNIEKVQGEWLLLHSASFHHPRTVHKSIAISKRS